MFETLSENLEGIFDRLTGRGALSEKDVDVALQEVRKALLEADVCLLYTSPSPRDRTRSRMPSSA